MIVVIMPLALLVGGQGWPEAAGGTIIDFCPGYFALEFGLLDDAQQLSKGGVEVAVESSV